MELWLQEALANLSWWTKLLIIIFVIERGVMLVGLIGIVLFGGSSEADTRSSDT